MAQPSTREKLLFTTCSVPRARFDIGNGSEMLYAIRDSIGHIFPHLNPRFDLEKVQWHFDRDSHQHLRPIDDLIALKPGGFGGSSICLHEVGSGPNSEHDSEPEQGAEVLEDEAHAALEDGLGDVGKPFRSRGQDDEDEDDEDEGEDDEGEDDDDDDRYDSQEGEEQQDQNQQQEQEQENDVSEEGSESEDDNEKDEDNNNDDDNSKGTSSKVQDRPQPQTPQIRIRLVYDLKGSPGIDLDQWKKSDAYRVDQNQDFRGFFEDMGRRVWGIVERVDKGLRDELKKAGAKQSLLLRPLLLHDCPVRRRAFMYDDSGEPRVLLCGGLLTDQEKANLNRGVEPEFVFSLRILESVKRNAETDPPIIIRPGAENMGSGGTSDFYSIGNKPLRANGVDSLVVDRSEAWFWCRNPVTERSKLVEAPVWSLRGLEICNPDEGQSHTTFPFKTTESSKPTNSEEFKRAWQAPGGLTWYTDGRLLYDFTSWSTKNLLPRPMQAFPTKPDIITIALRFVNHLENPEASTLRFSIIEELEVEKGDGFDSICQQIRDDLEGLQGPSRHPQAKALFKAPLQDQWTIELWVLPQLEDRGYVEDGGRVLYKYEGRRGSELFTFLDKALVKKGDTVLFVEVHIVPRVTPAHVALATTVSIIPRSSKKVNGKGKGKAKALK